MYTCISHSCQWALITVADDAADELMMMVINDVLCS